MLVFGTRPEAIKMAPVFWALSEQVDLFDPLILVTGQHREMLDQVLRSFSIKPDYDLDVMHQCQSLTDLTVRALPAIERILQLEHPDLVLVHGDTTTTFLAAWAAFYCRIPTGHVEAGLRTGNKYAPFPEEMNRRLTDGMAEWCFAPTEAARCNLLREGILPEQIFVTGNTVIDALLQTVSKPAGELPGVIGIPIPKDHRLILMTTHRRESWGGPLRDVYQALRRIIAECPDVELVFPVHRNPNVQKDVYDILGGVKRVHLCDPLDYDPFVQIMSRSYLVLTDSGGIQEEAPSLGIPVLVLRDTTERPEAVRAGTVKLVGTDSESIVQSVMELLYNDGAYHAMARAVNPYGDGRAAERIAAFLKWKYGFLESPPEPFNVQKE